MTELPEKRAHFIRQIIQEDLNNGKHKSIVTRFPPEPNGFLHIGHAKSICLNFGMAEEFGGKCLLRFDDTNPMKEEAAYVNAMVEDVHWLGFEWDAQTYSSDYYQQFYDYAVELIQAGKAYVDSLSFEQMREYRGTLQKPGKNSPYRERSIEENLELFQKMKEGAFQDGEHVLRAKIDMASANLNLRDPVLYRIRHAHHQQTGDAWCIYPMYDFAHPLSDALENITHSLCTLEFQDHRPLYEWFIENTSVAARPIQTEFSRLNVSHTVCSKRKLIQLVEDKKVDGWDDPRMPTLRGLRARGFPPVAIRNFCEEVGVSRSDSVIDMGLLEEAVRTELNQTAPRAMCVFDPIKVTIENFDDDVMTNLQASWNPNDEDAGQRNIAFSDTLYIERDDFMEEPPKKFFRLAPGKEVRLRHAYVIKCNDVIKDDSGRVCELKCTIDKETLGKKPEGRKVKGVIHWVSAPHAHPVQIVEFDRLFTEENPTKDEDFMQHLNPHSRETHQAYSEPALSGQPLDKAFQFERVGYYKVAKCQESTVSTWHRIVNLRDSWAKLSK